MEAADYNRLAAEKVLGWSIRKTGRWQHWGEAQEPWLWVQIVSVDKWDPYSNIAHAFELVEKLEHEGGFYLRLERDEAGDGWDALFLNGSCNASEFADTPSAAVTLAALKAAGVLDSKENRPPTAPQGALRRKL